MRAQALVADARVRCYEGDLAAQQQLEALARRVAPAHGERALGLGAAEALAVVEAARARDREAPQVRHAPPVEVERAQVEEHVAVLHHGLAAREEVLAAHGRRPPGERRVAAAGLRELVDAVEPRHRELEPHLEPRAREGLAREVAGDAALGEALRDVGGPLAREHVDRRLAHAASGPRAPPASARRTSSSSASKCACELSKSRTHGAAARPGKAAASASGAIAPAPPSQAGVPASVRAQRKKPPPASSTRPLSAQASLASQTTAGA